MLEGVSICLPAVVKASTDSTGRRLVEVEASNENLDSEGDIIEQGALLGSKDSFLRHGVLDLDHVFEIGDRLGIPNPEDYVVGKPLEVKDLGGGRTGVVGEIIRGKPKADEFWESLTGEPPIIWRASIYGFPIPGQIIDCRVSKAEDTKGATRFLVKGLTWKSLAFTRSPINDSIVGNARVITSKSLIEIAKARLDRSSFGLVKSPDYILSPSNPEELSGHYYYHIKAGKCPHVQPLSKSFQSHFQYCCGDNVGEATLKSLALVELINNHETSARVRIMDKSSLIESITSIFRTTEKAVEKALGDKLEGVREVEDLWQPERNEHENPSKREVLTGPAEAARGGNAQPQVRRNSDFAAQAGLTRQYEALDGLLADMAKAFNARLNSTNEAIKAVASAVEALQKAGEKDAPKFDENTFLGKAQSKLQKARVALRKADLADEEDKEEREERKSHLSSAADQLKAAKRLLSKASEDSKAEEEDEIEKAITDVRKLSDKVVKAQAEIVKAEDEEKKEEETKKGDCSNCPTCSPKVAKAEDEKEEEKEKEEHAKAATVKAEDESAKEEKEDDTAKANPQIEEHIKNTLAGFEVQLASMQDMFKAVMGQSRATVASPPTFMKAAPTADVFARLDAALDNGEVEGADAIYAQTLAQRLKAADAGKLKHEEVLAQIAAAKEPIRSIFQAAA